jgi:hypothetical protein
MAWTVILQNEEGQEISISNGEFDFTQDSLESYKLLKYLNPYGDTIFNNLQMTDLIDDLNKLKQISHEKLIDETIGLAVRCQNEVHLYLAFVGD